MYNSTQVKKLSTGERYNFGNGLFATCNKNNSVSLRIAGRVYGQRNRLTPRTYTVEVVNKDDERLTQIVMSASQKALHWKSLMQSGKDPTEEESKEKIKLEHLSLTFKEALEKYEHMARATETNTENTIRKRRSIFNVVCPDWFEKRIADITSDMIYNKYLEVSSGQVGKKRTGELFYSYFRAILNHLIDLKILEDNPCTSLKRYIKTRGRKAKDEFLIPSETTEFIRYLKSQTEKLPYKSWKNKKSRRGLSNIIFSKQQHNIIHFLLLSGLRLSEGLTIQRKDVHLEGTALHEEPYFTLVTSKQGEPYAIPITKEMMPIFKHQYNLTSFNILTKPTANKSVIAMRKEQKALQAEWIDKKFKQPRYLFLSKLDLHLTVQRKLNPTKAKGVLENRPPSSLVYAFNDLNNIMPKLNYARKITAQTLRHTFTTFGNLLGFSSIKLDEMTGHARPSTKTATSVYIARIAKSNRRDFEEIHTAMLGITIKDKDFKPHVDAIARQLDNATEEQLIDLFDKGLLTSEEEKKYGLTKDLVRRIRKKD